MNKYFSKLIENLALLFVLILSNQAFAQNSIISTPEQIEESVKSAPCDSEKRLEAVQQLFEKLGAKKDDIVIEKFDKDRISNLVVRKKGKTDETIIVGGHYDKTPDGCGVIDNWTGISIVAHLYRTIAQIETQKSYIFVAFDKEEKGLLGSEEMAKAIPKEKRSSYCSMVNLDSFGLGAPQALRNASDPALISIAKKLAKEAKIPFADASIGNADSDSSSFNKRGIPAISIHGLSNNWQNYLHTSSDQIKNVNMSSVYFGYRFGLSYIAELDAKPCSDNKK
ncbi:MAG: M28 family metallopeptidase [Acidobacteriota bacterium]|nr:M28 family metallopeptidase [Acidobacteriota bacterium]